MFVFSAPIALAFALVAAQTKQPSIPFTPTSGYAVRFIDGWRVRVEKRLLQDRPETAGQVLKLLDAQLLQVTRVIPADKLPKLQEVTIWVEFGIKDRHGACYHPGIDWLRQNNYNPDKWHGVEISNPDDFLSWTHEQPYMVLHELSHSYHDRVLGFDDPRIKACYDKAKASGKYDSVLRYDGSMEKHYALTNPQEYFAES